MTETIFRILAALIFFTGLGISAYFRSKADRDSGETLSLKDEGLVIKLTLRIGGLVLWMSMLGALIYPPLLAWSSVGLPAWIRWLGVGFGILSVGLTYWMFNNIGTGITPTVATRTEHQLVTSGPYRWIRHPLYTFGTLFFFSFALMLDSWFLAAMATLAIILLTIRLPQEEHFLIEKFGDEYREYMKTTGRYLPKFYRKDIP